MAAKVCKYYRRSKFKTIAFLSQKMFNLKTIKVVAKINF